MSSQCKSCMQCCARLHQQVSQGRRPPLPLLPPPGRGRTGAHVSFLNARRYEASNGNGSEEARGHGQKVQDLILERFGEQPTALYGWQPATSGQALRDSRQAACLEGGLEGPKTLGQLGRTKNTP